MCSFEHHSYKFVLGYDVTYCFTVFNTGDSYLGSVTVTSDDLGFTGSIEGNVPPQESKVLTFKTSIELSLIHI